MFLISMQIRKVYYMLHVTSYHQMTSRNLWAQKSRGGLDVWNYFASGHGKGKFDNEGVLLKRKIRKEQIKPQVQQLQNAHDVVHLC